MGLGGSLSSSSPTDCRSSQASLDEDLDDDDDDSDDDDDGDDDDSGDGAGGDDDGRHGYGSHVHRLKHGSSHP